MSLAPSTKTEVSLASAAKAKEAQKRKEHDLKTWLVEHMAAAQQASRLENNLWQK